MDTLKITYDATEGIPGIDTDTHNPLARALRNLFETGKPFARFSACYFDPSPISAGIRWFGSFVFSDGGRVVYFPGLSEPQRFTITSRNGGAVKQHALQADHFSLEADQRTWHITGAGPNRHLGSFPTTDLGEDRKLWFGMSLASGDVFRPLKSKTEVVAQLPETDTRRRAEVFKSAREGVVFNTLLFNRDVASMVPRFGHFSVIVGPCGFKPYRGEKLGLPVGLGMPFGSPFIKPPLSDLKSVPLRTHRLSLAPHVDIEIVTSILPGQVTLPVALTSPIA